MNPGDRLEVHIGGDVPGARPRPARTGPARVLVMADLGGDPAARPPLGGRHAQPVDLDRFEPLMVRVSPRVVLAADGCAVPGHVLEFASLDDFHPDALVRRVPLLRGLHDLRCRLLDPTTFAGAAAGLRDALAGTLPASAPAAPPVPAAAEATESDADTLARLLGGPPGPGAEPPPAGRPGPDLTALLRDIVAPHVVPAPDPRQDVYVAAVDEGLGVLLRALLRHPRFQALESTWRSLRFLVDRVEWGEDLELWVLDVTREELADDLCAPGARPEDSALARILADPALAAPGLPRWACLVVDLAFGPGAADLALLEALGRVAAMAGGPVLAGADPALLGCRSLAGTPDPAAWRLGEEDAARWRALRLRPAARRIGLALPRVLLRLPYGAAGDRIEGFAFEEVPDPAAHEAFLWGNAAFACALPLAEALAQGEAMPGDAEIADLPAHTCRVDGGTRLLPCAEVLLSGRVVDGILARGIMPLASHAQRNAVRLVRLQSVADPATALA